MSNQYTFQEFLLNCPYEDVRVDPHNQINLDDLMEIGTGYNLMDYACGFVKRGIKLSQLDRLIDTEEDFRLFVMTYRWIDELAIINDRPVFENPILNEYSQNTIKAYLYRFNEAGIKCSVLKTSAGNGYEAHD